MKVTLELTESEIAEAVRCWLDQNSDYSYHETPDIKFFTSSSQESTAVPSECSVRAFISMIEDIK